MTKTKQPCDAIKVFRWVM